MDEILVDKNKWLKLWEKNPMLRPYIAKVTANFGVGESGMRLEKAKTVCEQITGQKPKETRSKMSIRDFGIKKFEPIGCKVTLRGEKAKEFLEKALEAKGKIIPPSAFDNEGNISFGIEEHIDIPGTRYDPDLGVFGFDVSITIERPGFRIKRRHVRPRKISKKHRIKKEEAMTLLMEEFGIEITESPVELYY